MLSGLEYHISRSAKAHDGNSFRILRTIPGVGGILALTMLYEIHTIERFPDVGDFISYCRLIGVTSLTRRLGEPLARMNELFIAGRTKNNFLPCRIV